MWRRGWTAAGMGLVLLAWSSSANAQDTIRLGGTNNSAQSLNLGLNGDADTVLARGGGFGGGIGFRGGAVGFRGGPVGFRGGAVAFRGNPFGFQNAFGFHSGFHGFPVNHFNAFGFHSGAHAGFQNNFAL